ncbi:hypothetical protein [Corynebacterium neomassiliense]|uniref:hypothetical protein n=1 Tax=Corynebacterium neomassiliense TaxID=2079482 RepID=UPI001031D8BB|nr:hypothetical protein [Corynebacterium neomassiliense]
MTNIDRAAEVLRNTSVVTPHRGMDSNASTTFAQALADAGLLAPDLPEPDGKGYTGHPTWCADAVEPRGGLVEIYHGGYANGENEDIYTPSEAREFALGILAAADHAERNQK